MVLRDHDAPNGNRQDGEIAVFLLSDLPKTRDRTCTGPGCDIAADDCEIDHIIEWQDGGQTSANNSNLKCGWHHRWKHRYTITKHPKTGKPTWHLKTKPPPQK